MISTTPARQISGAKYQIHLFGAITLQRGKKNLALPSPSSARTLLAYLSLYRQRPHSRAVLVGLFWPDWTEARARRALSRALWHISRCLPGIVQADDDSIHIPPHAPIWVDVTEFEALAEPHLHTSLPLQASVQNLYQAIQLYRGDLLEGFYDDWLLVERERLREMYLQVLERLVEYEKSAGHYRQALELALTLTNADPLREVAHREVMRLYFVLNRPEAALKQFTTCRQILHAELGLEPEPETTSLAREIANRSDHSLAPYLPEVSLPSAWLRGGPSEPIALQNVPSLEIPLLGRRDERTALLTHVEALFGGHGGVVLIEGEAGVGKTRLLQEIARDAEWRGAQVMLGRGRELEAARPYGPLLEALAQGLSPLRAEQLVKLVDKIWLQVLGSLLPYLTQALPDLGRPAPIEPSQERTRLAEAFTQLLFGWARITPAVLILEDLQWVQAETLDVLVQMARRLSQCGALIIGSYRREEARTQPALWEKLGLCERFLLKPLDAAATSELIRRSLGLAKPAPRFEARLYQETNGNPLFVLETLRALYDEGLLSRDASGDWSTPWDKTTSDYAEMPLPIAIERVIARRLAQLSDETRETCHAATVLGSHFDFTLLQAVDDQSTETLLQALRELVQRRLLEETLQDYRFSHDKVRQVVYSAIAPEARVLLHRRAAQVLETLHPDQVDSLAHHFTEGQVRDKAVHYHRLAGERASNLYAYSTALDHYDRAMTLANAAQLTPIKRYDLLAAREASLDVLGDREAQAADLDTMERLARDINDPARLVKVYEQKAWLLRDTGRYDQAEATARQSLTLATQTGDAAARAAALAALAAVIHGRGDDRQAIPYFQSSISLYQNTADRRGESQAHKRLAVIFADASQYTLARAEVEAALTLDERSNDQPGYAYDLAMLAWILGEQGVVDEAQTHCQRALEICRAIGYKRGEAIALAMQLHVLPDRGQIGRTLAVCDKAIEICQSLGEQKLQAFLRVSLPWLYISYIGDYETGARKIEEALEFSRRAGFQYQISACEGDLGCLALRQGNLQVAREHLQSALIGLQATPYRQDETRVRRFLIELELAAGQPKAALEHLAATEAICQQAGRAGVAVNLLADRGAVLLALGQPKEALTATAEAMARLLTGIGVEQAYLIPFAHYRVLTDLGRTDEARAALQHAYQMLCEVIATLSPEHQKMSWERVPEHHVILAAWQATQPQRVTVHLPRQDAPTGRPLRDDEWVKVTWAIAQPDDGAIPDKTVRRQQCLLRLLREAEGQGALPTVDTLAAALRVSRATIKRDLAALRRSERSVRTRGSRSQK